MATSLERHCCTYVPLLYRRVLEFTCTLVCTSVHGRSLKWLFNALHRQIQYILLLTVAEQMPVTALAHASGRRPWLLCCPLHMGPALSCLPCAFWAVQECPSCCQFVLFHSPCLAAPSHLHSKDTVAAIRHNLAAPLYTTALLNVSCSANAIGSGVHALWPLAASSLLM